VSQNANAGTPVYNTSHKLADPESQSVGSLKNKWYSLNISTGTIWSCMSLHFTDHYKLSPFCTHYCQHWTQA